MYKFVESISEESAREPWLYFSYYSRSMALGGSNTASN
jgi:hypothetical protein